VDREIAPTHRWSVGELRKWAEVAEFSNLTARSVIMYDVSSDKYIVNLDGDRELPPASLTKLIKMVT
jgi:D-alanyl-D-alanine carboxypeptidase